MALFRHKQSGDIYVAHGQLATYYASNPRYEPVPEQPVTGPATQPVTLANMTDEELRTHAAQHRVKVSETATRAELIAAITKED